MYSSARSAAARSLGSAIVVGRGHDVAERHALAGVRAPRDEGLELVRVEEDLGVVDGALVAGKRAPVGDGILPVLALAARAAGPSRYAKVVSSGATMPARAPASIDMLQIVMRPSIERARIALPRNSST